MRHPHRRCVKPRSLTRGGDTQRSTRAPRSNTLRVRGACHLSVRTWVRESRPQLLQCLSLPLLNRRCLNPEFAHEKQRTQSCMRVMCTARPATSCRCTPGPGGVPTSDLDFRVPFRLKIGIKNTLYSKKSNNILNIWTCTATHATFPRYVSSGQLVGSEQR